MYSDKEWDNLEQKTLETWPNTYIYTKTMTENYVHASGKNLPISIFRPAIIGSIYQNPASGWIDKPFGPVGLGLSLACGLLGVMFLNGNNRMEVVPVDLCVNSLLQSAHDVAQKSLQEPLVFNFTTFKGNTISNQKFIDYILLHLKQYPFTKSVWYSRITLTMNPYIYTILNFLNHKIPCCMIDLWMIMSGQKPRYKTN
jgi:alcohol-forming fatty acyl-CoA reductase